MVMAIAMATRGRAVAVVTMARPRDLVAQRISGVRAKSDLVTLEKHGRVGVLRLNDPKRLNPMTAAMGTALQGRGFSAGGDMKFLQERITDTPSRNSVLMQKFYARYMSLRTLQVPLVAAINGPAIGAGLCISLFADVRVAAKDAKMGFTFVNLGLHPGMASSHFLPLIVGTETANYLMLTGKVIDGTEAQRLRLVSKAVDKDEVVKEAIALAEEMASTSSTATRAVLRTLRARQDVGLAAALLREADTQATSFATVDYAEGLRAIAEKRDPCGAPRKPAAAFSARGTLPTTLDWEQKHHRNKQGLREDMSAEAAEKQRVEAQLLQAVDAASAVQDSYEYALQHALSHELVVGVMKSLLADAFVVSEELSTSFYVLKDEARSFLEKGSPEVQVFHAIPASEGIDRVSLEVIVGAATLKVGQGACMKNRWIRLDKADGKFYRNAESVADEATEVLRRIESAEGALSAVTSDEAKNLKRRNLVEVRTRKSYKITKGPNFSLQRKKQAAGLNKEMLEGDAWKKETFKPYNFNTLGLAVGGGHLHPLMKVRAEFRRVLMDMGFQEMPTNRYVESSFWNFDSLFQPQSHPARDAHDTFFLSKPQKCLTVPEDYYERVEDMHENGGFGSIGHGRGAFKRETSMTNILRTHTTAISAQMLYKLANQPGGFTPQKYFSIDRVFRNESMDATHLAEFHQVEGVVADYDLSLGDLIGVIKAFFEKIGITKMRFKPAYNPYTEPSMEIFAFHPDLNKWTEIGNSGVFRPEMLRPMGLPENVRVIAWGLSLERPTMIKYRLSNIRDLFGHKIDLEQTRTAKLYRY